MCIISQFILSQTFFPEKGKETFSPLLCKAYTYLLTIYLMQICTVTPIYSLGIIDLKINNIEFVIIIIGVR